MATTVRQQSMRKRRNGEQIVLGAHSYLNRWLCRLLRKERYYTCEKVRKRVSALNKYCLSFL